MNTHTRGSVFLVVVFVVAGRTWAAPESAAERLARCLPERSLVVVAWSGSDHAGEAFRQSAVGKVFHEESVQSFITDIKKAIWSTVPEPTDSDERVMIDVLREGWPIVLQSPGAIVVVAGDPKSDFAITAALVSEAGRYREKIDPLLTQLHTVDSKLTEVRIGEVRLESDPEEGIAWGWVGERFVIGVGDLTPLVDSLLTGKQALSASPEFTKRLAAVPAEHELALGYFDAAGIMRLVQEAAGSEGAEQFKTVEAVLRTLGLADLGGVLGRVSVRGPEILVNTTVFTPSPRRGVWRCIDGQVGLDRMEAVPAGAAATGAGTFRIAEVLPLVIESIRAAAPDEADEVVASIDAFEQQSAVPIRKHILDNFAGAYTYYIMPGGQGGFVPGMVLMLDVKDGPKMEEGMVLLERWAAPQVPPNMITVKTKTADGENVAIHTWNLLTSGVPLQAGWSVYKGKLVLELAAGTLGGGVGYLMTGGPKFMDDPAIAALAGKLPPDTSHYSFSNDRMRVADSMNQLMMVWSMAQMGAAQAAGMTLPFLPPAGDIVKHLGLSFSYSYTDDLGLHARSAGTAPGGDPVIITAVSASMVSVLLPSLSRARELSKRLVSAANVKGIVISCKIYANENDDNYPPSLQSLIDSGEISPKQVKNPRVDQKNYDKPDHYIYVPGHTESGPRDLVVVYENPAYVDEGINIGFVDGHAQFVKGEEALAKVRATYSKMSLDVPNLAYARDRSPSFLQKFNPESAGKKNRHE